MDPIRPDDPPTTDGEPPPAQTPPATQTQPPAQTPPPPQAPPPTQPGDPDSPKPIEIVFGLSVMISWLILFGVGIVCSSKTYEEKLGFSSPASWRATWNSVGSFLAFLLTYTVTNALLLCVLASALGQSGRRDRIVDEPNGVVKSRPGQYLGAMLRGFMSYLFLVSGSVVIANKTYDNPTRQDYLTFAATVSVLGFLAGYNPSLFVRFMNGIRYTLPPVNNRAARDNRPGATP